MSIKICLSIPLDFVVPFKKRRDGKGVKGIAGFPDKNKILDLYKFVKIFKQGS